MYLKEQAQLYVPRNIENINWGIQFFPTRLFLSPPPLLSPFLTHFKATHEADRVFRKFARKLSRLFPLRFGNIYYLYAFRDTQNEERFLLYTYKPYLILFSPFFITRIGFHRIFETFDQFCE